MFSEADASRRDVPEADASRRGVPDADARANFKHGGKIGWCYEKAINPQR